MKIVIADDSKASRMLLKTMLAACLSDEVCFYFAENGEEAVNVYLSEQPDLAFFDLTMPVKNGMDALSEVVEQQPHAKVVVVTADGQKVNHDRALQLGAIDYINKPIDQEKIKRKLQVWL